VFPITLPPLREHREDIPGLVEFFLRRHGASSDKITASALRALQQQPLPGNVRELEHALERAMILAGSGTIEPSHLPAGAVAAGTPGAGAAGAGARAAGADGAPAWVPEIPPEGLSLEVLERELILRALTRASGNKSQAARLLGLTRRTLYSRMERHGLRRPGEGEEPGEDQDSEPGNPAGGNR